MKTIHRRNFLQGAGAGLLLVSFQFSELAHAATASLSPAKSIAKDVLDTWLTIDPSNQVTVYVGKVDLGTGTKTALSQIAAEELSIPFDKVTMVMGDTATTPDQWITGAALTIQQGGSELRIAAASARQALLARAAQRWDVPVSALQVANGVVIETANPSRQIKYGDLIGEGFQIKVDPKASLKAHTEYTLVGRSVPRVDIPAKVTGEHPYVHDFKLPGMLHARVVRSTQIGAKLASVDDREARKVRGYVATVRQGDFLAVVCDNEWSAVKASRVVRAQWTPGPDLPAKDQLDKLWRQMPLAKEEATQKVGQIDTAFASAQKTVKASYHFAVQTHASIGPSCAVAQYENGQLVVWSASQATHSMQHELSVITRLPKEKIRLIYLDGSGCYGRNGHEDATADAALIAIELGRPVRVQWMRHDETALAPKSPPRAMDLEAALDANGNIQGWKGDFYIALNHIQAFKPLDFPLLSATETGVPRPGNWVGFLFQNAGAPYAVPNIQVTTKHVAQTFLRASHLRSPGRIENSFANESFMDELAYAAGADAAEFRLRHLQDARGKEVLGAALKAAQWQARPSAQVKSEARVVRGRGIAYVRYNNAITYVTTVAEVEVDRKTGQVKVLRLVVAHDCGQMINPDGVLNQIQGGAIQTVSRTLMEDVRWSGSRIESVDWGSYPILRFGDVPKVEAVLIDRPGLPTWGAGEQTPTTIPAAIANAIFDATGARLRQIPFAPSRVLAALQASGNAMA
ncbi:molybdopterin cofactor-binding domain-containing protein [Limnohabitans sp.]|uniref:xanthine dehydrogenase family protein molybdopterin-binding subunit n=1 Tax=Limnohabitans sp. TaxID=1907725 RepID=UPI0038BC6C75